MAGLELYAIYDNERYTMDDQREAAGEDVNTNRLETLSQGPYECTQSNSTDRMYTDQQGDARVLQGSSQKYFKMNDTNHDGVVDAEMLACQYAKRPITDRGQKLKRKYEELISGLDQRFVQDASRLIAPEKKSTRERPLSFSDMKGIILFEPYSDARIDGEWTNGYNMWFFYDKDEDGAPDLVSLVLYDVEGYGQVSIEGLSVEHVPSAVRMHEEAMRMAGARE